MIDVRSRMIDNGAGRFRIGPDASGRPVIGRAVHHSVTPNSRHFDTEVQEFAHIREIESEHVGAGYGVFGYHFAAFPSGRVYWCGDFHGARSHVASRNHELLGVVAIGTFTDGPPGAAQLAGVVEALAYMRAEYGDLPINGHRFWALPQYPTACPGVWPWPFGEEDDVTPDQLKQAIREVLDEKRSDLGNRSIPSYMNASDDHIQIALAKAFRAAAVAIEHDTPGFENTQPGP